MSGHSKWAKIKRAKGANDAKRGQLFTKIANQITIAAKEGGGDPDTNFILRMQIEKARQANMPSANIQKAIDRGTGKSKEGANIQKITYEGVGPGGVGVLVDCLTDNTNRTVSEIRAIFERMGGNLGSSNSVAWQFEEKGLITLRSAKIQKSEKYGKGDEIIEVNPEELELELYEIDGIEDIISLEVEEDDEIHNGFEVFTSKKDLDKVRKAVENMQIKIISAELIKKAERLHPLDPKYLGKVKSLIEVFEDHDDVENVWVNVEINQLDE